jgi:hypothetical protein
MCGAAVVRLRVWDYLLSVDGPPDREIVHSHDFNRYLTPFRAEWDPKDSAERTVVVGRCVALPGIAEINPWLWLPQSRWALWALSRARCPVKCFQ